MKQRTTTTWLRMVIAGGALLLGACATGASSPQTTDAPTTTTEATTTETPAPATAEVSIEGFLFEPESLTVEAGTTVTWTNQDRILHTVTAGTPEQPGDRFDGDLDGAGSTFSVTFDEPGTYEYFCDRHNHMRGTITVDG